MIKNLALGHKRKGKISDPFLIDIVVNDLLVTMEVDCGAAYSVMSFNMYLELFPDRELKPIIRKLSVITGESIKVVGQMEATVAIYWEVF